ncbi:oxidoreductase [Vibrio sp. VB16]|uniref:oxidoreductase n=1 Tax=Vibrio sp. VB16 TaxID=2785746 RepID=UPI00189EB410|nr:oxidoreductase [Vibrio sp. VB16]UGA56672.1 oxidoreductase [Vibrio sp. VB16]
MRVLIFGLMVVLLSPVGLARDLILEVSNKPVKIVTFDELKSMPSISYKTHLPWFTGEAEFTGVSLEYFLTKQFGAIPDIVTFRALNDYSVEIVKSDIEKFDPIIAYLKDGKEMTIREKGPYWIIYSLSDFPRIDDSLYHAQMIWQLEKIQIDSL